MRIFHQLKVIFVVCCVVAGLAAQSKPTSEPRSLGKAPAENTTASGSILRELDEAMDQVAERVLPAVVQISVSGFGPSRQRSESENVIERQRGIGSGVIVDHDGYIVTNAHVVAGAQRIQVIMRSVTTELIPRQTSLLHRQRSFAARLIGVHRFTDLALLKIDQSGLPYIPLKEVYKARLGQTVLALGSPQ